MVDAGRRSRWRSLYSRLQAGEFQTDLFIVEILFKRLCISKSFGIVQEVESGGGPLGFFRLDMRTLRSIFGSHRDSSIRGLFIIVAINDDWVLRFVTNSSRKSRSPSIGLRSRSGKCSPECCGCQ